MNLEEQVIQLHRTAAVSAFNEAREHYGSLEITKGYEAEYPHTTLSVAHYLEIEGDSEQRKRLNASKLALPWFTMPGLKGKRVFHKDLVAWLAKEQVKTPAYTKTSNFTTDIPDDIKAMLGDK